MVTLRMNYVKQYTKHNKLLNKRQFCSISAIKWQYLLPYMNTACAQEVHLNFQKESLEDVLLPYAQVFNPLSKF